MLPLGGGSLADSMDEETTWAVLVGRTTGLLGTTTGLLPAWDQADVVFDWGFSGLILETSAGKSSSWKDESFLG